MREDAEKVFTDPARRGSSDPSLDVIRGRRFISNHRKDVEALDSLPFTDPMKRLDWGWGKGINSDFRFIRKFLESRCGMLWDDVYKEVCDVTTATHPEAGTLRHYIRSSVETQIKMVNGVPYYFSKYNGWAKLSDYGGWRRSTFYVNPETGKLEKAVHVKRVETPKDPTRYIISETEELQKIDGIWYRTERFQNGYRSEYNGASREWNETHSMWAWKSLFKSVPNYYWTKKQLNKKELKKYGLQNG